MKRKRQLPKNVIGPLVQRRRTELGWSQSDLATKCQVAGWNISRSVVAAIEGRVRWAGDYEVALLAGVLKIATERLYPTSIDWADLGLKQINLPRRGTR